MTRRGLKPTGIAIYDALEQVRGTRTIHVLGWKHMSDMTYAPLLHSHVHLCCHTGIEVVNPIIDVDTDLHPDR